MKWSLNFEPFCISCYYLLKPVCRDTSSKSCSHKLNTAATVSQQNKYTIKFTTQITLKQTTNHKFIIMTGKRVLRKSIASLLEFPTLFVASCSRPHLLTFTDDISLAVTCCPFKVKAEWEVEQEDFRSGAIHSESARTQRVREWSRPNPDYHHVYCIHFSLLIVSFCSDGYVGGRFPPSLLHVAGTREYIRTLWTFLMT